MLSLIEATFDEFCGDVLDLFLIEVVHVNMNDIVVIIRDTVVDIVGGVIVVGGVVVGCIIDILDGSGGTLLQMIVFSTTRTKTFVAVGACKTFLHIRSIANLSMLFKILL